jgi:Homeodomain-like domain
LLWLAEQESITAIARRLRVSRQTIYHWATHFRQRSGSVGSSSLLVERFKPQRIGSFGLDSGQLRPGFGGAGTQPGHTFAASAF